MKGHLSFQVGGNIEYNCPPSPLIPWTHMAIPRYPNLPCPPRVPVLVTSPSHIQPCPGMVVEVMFGIPPLEMNVALPFSFNFSCDKVLSFRSVVVSLLIRRLGSVR